MGEGLLNETRLKIGDAGKILGEFSWRRDATIFRYVWLKRVTDRSANNTAIIAS
jgi:hypothetical protein